MTGNIETLKTKILQSLLQEFEIVRPQRASSKQVHLEVWQVRGRDRSVGVEFLLERVNFWMTTQNVLENLPSSVDRVDKVPDGRGWTDAAGEGANSNLSSYDSFRTRKITRLGVRSEADAMMVLNHLLR